MHILSPVTDNCSSWISGRRRMAVEMFSWPSLHERMCRTWGSNSGPLACQANSLPIELPRPVSLNGIHCYLNVYWNKHTLKLHDGFVPSISNIIYFAYYQLHILICFMDDTVLLQVICICTFVCTLKPISHWSVMLSFTTAKTFQILWLDINCQNFQQAYDCQYIVTKDIGKIPSCTAIS